MSGYAELAWKSLNKYQEELCGDRVETVSCPDSDILVLSDGMGSGVKANILATLTSRILSTMLQEGMEIDACVETVARTLPVEEGSKEAYAAFSVLQLFHDGRASLIEFDDPACIYLHQGEIREYPVKERLVAGKRLRESAFQVEPGDFLILLTDGMIWAGAGQILNYGWTRDCVADYARKCVQQPVSASRLATLLVESCNALYEGKAGDDTTAAVARIRTRSCISLFTGPPEDPAQDEKAVRAFLASAGRHIITGGTTAQIVARVLDEKLDTSVDQRTDQKEIPPASRLKGMDLVTEGVITLGHAVTMMEQFAAEEVSATFFEQLDQENAAAKIARMLLEDCTELHLFVGRAVNEAHGYAGMDFKMTIRSGIIRRMVTVCEKLGIVVICVYY